MKLLVFAGLSEKKLLSKLLPILELKQVDRLFLIRKEPLVFTHPKLSCCCPPKGLSKFPGISDIIRFIIGIRLCLRQCPNVIMGYYFFMHGLFAIALSTLFQTNSVIMFLGTDLFWNISRSPWKHFWLKWITKATFIGVRGQNSKKWLESHGIEANKIFIPANFYEFPDIPEQSNSVSNKMYDLIMIADINPEKRVDLFLTIVYRLQKKIPSIRAVIVGDGVLKSKMIDLSKKIGIDQHVDFVGYQENCIDFIVKSKVFILTSRQEGLPISMIEAMGFGLACVLPDIGDISSVATNRKNAIIVPADTIDSFVSAVEALLTNSTLYKAISFNAKCICNQKKAEYSLSSISNVWGDIFEQCIY
ncbi:MAG: glycosyltransferase [Desulfobacterales bacterium]|nr:glycosyltransferase [Desulfobacterales bacterium]